MFNKRIIRNNAIAFAILGVLMGIQWLPGIGLAAILIGLVDLLAGLLMLAIRNKQNGLTMLLCAGVLLLIGFSVCSNTQIDFH